MKKLISAQQQKDKVSKINFNDEIYVEDASIAENFNNYFINSIGEIVDSIPRVDIELNVIQMGTQLELLNIDQLYEIVMT